MRIKVGGCFGSVAPGYNSVGFLVDGHLLLEGGTVTSVFSLEEQKAISDIIISHIHLDHTKELFFLLDNLFQMGSHPITLSGIEEIVDGVRTHLFNEQLWPDFSRLPDDRSPLLTFRVIPEESYSTVGALAVKPVRVNHPVPSTGYLLRSGDTVFGYTGDTGPTERFWEEAAGEENLKGLFVEVSFPNGMEDLALASGHLTPALLEKELSLLGRPEVPVYIFHMKPLFLEKIRGEVSLFRGRRAEILQEGRTYEF